MALGDFNAKHRQWNSSSTYTTGTTLLGHISSRPQMRVHAPHEPTRIPPNMPHKADILDLAISNNWHYPTDNNVLHALTSDHLPIPQNSTYNSSNPTLSKLITNDTDSGKSSPVQTLPPTLSPHQTISTRQGRTSNHPPSPPSPPALNPKPTP